MIARILAIALLFGLLLPASGPVLAQDQQCEAQPSFPSGWTVTHGNTSGNAVFGTHGTLPDGVGSNEGLVVSVEKSYGDTRAWSTIQFDYEFFIGLNTNPLVASFTVYNGGVAVANRTLRTAPITASGWTTGVNVTFNGEVGDTLKVDLYHFTDDGQIGLRVNAACTYAVVTVTPSVLPTSTDTATPSNTPTPSLTITPSPTTGPSPTPTYTLTPTLTVTPGGPTVTPIPPSATGAPITPATSTLQGLVAGGNIFSTIPAPKGCASGLANSCGELPFAVPGFATLNFASPTRLPSNTPGGGFQSLTPGAGTPTGTLATATSGPSPTGTMGNSENALSAFATRVVAGRTMVAFNATLTGPDGNLIDIRNSGHEIGASIGGFFGEVRGLQSLFLGRAGQLIAFLLLCAGFVIIVKLTVFTIQVLLGLTKWLTRFINALKP